MIDESQRDELIRIAHAGDRILSAEIRRAVAKHLERATPEPEETPLRLGTWSRAGH